MHEQNPSQTSLSNLTGISKSSLSQYLSGTNTPHRGRIAEIAFALGVSVGHLTANLRIASTELPPTDEEADFTGKGPCATCY